MSNNKTCEERIGEELTWTERWLSETYQKIDEAIEAGNDRRADALSEEVQPYGMSVRAVMTLELAGGGPAAWLEVELDRGQWGFEPVRVVYHYAWGDHAEREVFEGEASGIWRMAEYYAEHAKGLIETGRW